jgi:molybdopterin-binding protein
VSHTRPGYSQPRPGELPPILEASELSVVYGSRKVLDVPSLQVDSEKVLCLIGPNGSGKTTLMLCLSLLLKPTTGNILYKGNVVPRGSSITRMRRHFAVAFQEPLLLNNTVWDNVTLGLRLRGFKKPEINKRAQLWLERFGISSKARQPARTLSGGEAQRASLARAFALQPEVLFLDEPFSALDTPTRQGLFGDMVSILQETRLTTIMVTHDRNEAQTLAHRIIMLSNGRVVQEGTPREIFSAPINEEVARFVGMENVVDGRATMNRDLTCDIEVRGQTIEGVVDCRASGTVYVCIKPEDLTLSLNKDSASGFNLFSGKIVSLIASGSLVRVNIDCGFPLVALITRMAAEELHLEKGQNIHASFKTTSIHVISRN